MENLNTIKDIIKYGKAEVTYKNKQALAQNPILYNLFWKTTLRCNAKCKHCGRYHWGMTTNAMLINDNNIKQLVSSLYLLYYLLSGFLLSLIKR